MKAIRDKHERRSGDDYTQAFLRLLPQGQAWPRSTESTLYKACNGLSQYWGFVDGRAGDLLETESDPRKTVELLGDWEYTWGLPDPCFFKMPLTMTDRRNILLLKMTMIGGQSRPWFTYIATWLGYSIRITEYAPFMAGVSRCGDTTAEERATGSVTGGHRWYIGLPEMRFMWTVHIDNARLTWFRAGAGECGVDHLLTIGLALDLECMLRAWKPAHTELIFDYSSLATGGSMAGTP